MPKSRRDEVAALITVLALLEGVFFDTRDFRRLPHNRNVTNRVLQALLESKVLMRIHDRRNYVLTDTFRDMLRSEVKRKAPSSGIHQFPSLDVFYVGGMEDWSEHEFETYVGEMKAMWRRLSQSRGRNSSEIA
jgi:hypothetical protein